MISEEYKVWDVDITGEDEAELVLGCCDAETAAVCAVDCLLQWEEGLLDDTIKAWNRSLLEHRDGLGHTDSNRHDAWVPSIPLK